MSVGLSQEVCFLSRLNGFKYCGVRIRGPESGLLTSLRDVLLSFTHYLPGERKLEDGALEDAPHSISQHVFMECSHADQKADLLKCLTQKTCSLLLGSCECL